MSKTTIEQLWSAACSGDIDTLKQYYRHESDVINRRYSKFKREHSLIMGAFRNRQFEIVDYLLSVGETVTEQEEEEILKELKGVQVLQKIVKGEDSINQITAVWDGIISMLAREPRSYDTADDPGFWTNGNQILCPSETDASIVAEFLKDICSEYGNFNILTGYYDPFEDAENGEQDECTGFWYVEVE